MMTKTEVINTNENQTNQTMGSNPIPCTMSVGVFLFCVWLVSGFFWLHVSIVGRIQDLLFSVLVVEVVVEDLLALLQREFNEDFCGFGFRLVFGC